MNPAAAAPSSSSSIKRDDHKQSWEDTEFPLVCETCLGDNPYVRMTKESFGKKCQICDVPFTVFAWQAGTKGRLKRVEICKTCAQAKNVCQVCIYDLQYGLPVKVRDKILREAGSTAATGMVPESHANRAWHRAQQQQQQQEGTLAITAANPLAAAQLQEMAQMEPRYERNLPKLCSFFARGECNRGANCPFRHEMPRDRNDPLAKQNTRDRFYGTSDPVANKILGRRRREDETMEKNQSQEQGYDRARATLYLRFQGDPPYPTLTETDIRDQFYAFGEIVSVRLQADKGQAFVEYTQPDATELAIASMNKKTLLGKPLYVAWARAVKQGEGPAGAAVHPKEDGGRHSATGTVVRTKLLPPPGGKVSVTSVPVSVKPAPSIVAKVTPALTSTIPPRPGGGPIRGHAAAAARRTDRFEAKPYYPSADPSRLGSKATR